MSQGLWQLLIDGQENIGSVVMLLLMLSITVAYSRVTLKQNFWRWRDRVMEIRLTRRISGVFFCCSI